MVINRKAKAPTPVRLWYAPAGLASCPAGSALSSAHSEARVLRSDLRGDPAPGPGTLLPHEEAAPQGLWGLTREEGGSPGVPLGVCPWGTWRAPVSAPGQALYSGGHGGLSEAAFFVFKEKLTVNGAGLGTGTLEHRQRLDFRAASGPPEWSRKWRTGRAGFPREGAGTGVPSQAVPRNCQELQAPACLCLVPLTPGLFSGAPADTVPCLVPWPSHPRALESQGQETLFLRSSRWHPSAQQEGHSRRWPG